MPTKDKAEVKVTVQEDKAIDALVVARKSAIGVENIKQVIISIIIGACVAFFSTLFQGLADYLKDHAVEAVSAMATSLTYLAKTYKG